MKIVADGHYIKCLLRSFQSACRVSKAEELARQQRKLEDIRTFKEGLKTSQLKRIVSQWKAITEDQKLFHKRLNRVLTLRALNICRTAYSSWALVTKKRERHRKVNQLAACFYLHKMYQRVFSRGFKHHYKLSQKGKDFMARRYFKIVGKCWGRWRKEFYSNHVVYQIDGMRSRTTKKHCFDSIAKYAATRREHRELHNAFVMRKLGTLKAKAFTALKKHAREARKVKEDMQAVHGDYLSKQAFRVFKSWRDVAQESQETRKYCASDKIRKPSRW